MGGKCCLFEYALNFEVLDKNMVVLITLLFSIAGQLFKIRTFQKLFTKRNDRILIIHSGFKVIPQRKQSMYPLYEMKDNSQVYLVRSCADKIKYFPSLWLTELYLVLIMN